MFMEIAVAMETLARGVAGEFPIFHKNITWAFVLVSMSLVKTVVGVLSWWQVETVGDAYVVVSGLPKPNAGRHIAEICSMVCLDKWSVIRGTVTNT